MIVIKVELWPKGDEKTKREIGRTYIANTGEMKSLKRGNYKVAVCRRGTTKCPFYSKTTKAVREGKVLDYPRLRYNMWRLIIRALKSAFPEEK